MKDKLHNDRDHLVGKNHGNYAGNIPERESKKREWIIESGLEKGILPGENRRSEN